MHVDTDTDRLNQGYSIKPYTFEQGYFIKSYKLEIGYSREIFTFELYRSNHSG